MLCDYGCNREFLFEFKNKKKCCSKDFDSCPAFIIKKTKIIKDVWDLKKNNPEEYLKKPKRETTLLPITEELDCDYGCGKPFQFTLKNERKCCSSNSQSCEIIKKKNFLGCKLVYSSGERLPAKELYKTLSDDIKSKIGKRKKYLMPYETLFKLVKRENTGIVKGYIIHHKLKEYKCELCHIEKEWNRKPITLELDHIDGNNLNNQFENLRFLCISCHSQTNTYRNKKRNFNYDLEWLHNKILSFKTNYPGSLNHVENDILLFGKGSTLKKYIFYYNLLEYKCNECDIIDTWNEKMIVLEIDHKDGNNKNNLISNLRFLCPNCHSQTNTFRNKKRI